MKLTINTTPEQDAAIEAARLARLVDGVPQFDTPEAHADFVIQDALNGQVAQHVEVRVDKIKAAVSDPVVLAAVEAVIGSRV